MWGRFRPAAAHAACAPSRGASAAPRGRGDAGGLAASAGSRPAARGRRTGADRGRGSGRLGCRKRAGRRGWRAAARPGAPRALPKTKPPSSPTRRCAPGRVAASRAPRPRRRRRRSLTHAALAPRSAALRRRGRTARGAEARPDEARARGAAAAVRLPLLLSPLTQGTHSALDSRPPVFPFFSRTAGSRSRWRRCSWTRRSGSGGGRRYTRRRLATPAIYAAASARATLGASAPSTAAWRSAQRRARPRPVLRHADQYCM